MELFRALAVLAEPPTRETAGLAEVVALGAVPSAEAYTELFLFQLYPFASVYLGEEGMLGGEARDRIAGFWRALGDTPPTEPDHLATLLGLYAHLAGLEEAESRPGERGAIRRARATLLYEHLLSWLPPYLEKLIDISPGLPPYQAWARLLHRALLDEASRTAGPPSLPLHLRAAPPLPEEDSWHALIPGLLAPVRSGIIMTRADLARGAHALGLGLRAGERRLALESLVDQDPDGVWNWMANEATIWQRRHAGLVGVLGPIAEFWADRAKRTAARLAEPRMGRGNAVLRGSIPSGPAGT